MVHFNGKLEILHEAIQWYPISVHLLVGKMESTSYVQTPTSPKLFTFALIQLGQKSINHFFSSWLGLK